MLLAEYSNFIPGEWRIYFQKIKYILKTQIVNWISCTLSIPKVHRFCYLGPTFGWPTSWSTNSLGNFWIYLGCRGFFIVVWVGGWGVCVFGLGVFVCLFWGVLLWKRWRTSTKQNFRTPLQYHDIEKDKLYRRRKVVRRCQNYKMCGGFMMAV